MSHFVFIESNTTGTGAIAVERMLARGDRVTFLTRSREKYPFLADPKPGLEVAGVETNDVEAIAAFLGGLLERTGVDVVLTFSDFYVAIVAEVAARFGFRYLSPAPARTCRSKLLTREALRRAGLPTPDFWRLSSEEEALRLSREVRYPCVVKPPSDSSSYGVRVVRDAGELLAQYRALSAETANVRGQALDGTVLVESYLDGPEYSVETVTLPGGPAVVLGVTDKHLSPPPHFVETGHDFPSAADPAVVAGLAGATTAALDAVGFDFGPAHTELRWTERGPVVVEINARLAGGMIPELVRYALGVDLLDTLLDLLLGRPVDLRPTRHETASVRFLTVDRRGRLAGWQGAEAARSLPTVREVFFGKEAGALVQPAENAYHRLGFVIAAGPDRSLVQADLQRALAALHAEVEPSSL
ncbi:MAG TPA: ATP-grasp domain-containing protein [Thermoanaerobaculia bacterium]|nr:ATP-grasp domain-containing protein [Thermoanaerobaculia bacterium]